MAEAIQDEYGIKSTLIEGSGGVFDVALDGQRVWSKQEAGRFPENDEVIAKLAKLVGRA